MVDFFSSRMPAQMRQYIISADREGGKLLLQAEPDRIRDAVSYWLDSSKTNRYTIAGDTIESRVAEEGGLFLTSATLYTGGGLLRNDEPETFDDVVVSRVQRKDAGSLLGVEADFPQSLKEVGFGDSNYNEEAIVEGILDWVGQNKERVTLGYGPNHPLDNIDPLAVGSNYVPRGDMDIVENFSNWLVTVVENTVASTNEHAFYVDENNNTIGVIGGGRSSVKYPSAKPGETSVSAHTHPTIKSLAFPSETDLKTNAFRCTEESVEMIALANGHSNFILPQDEVREETPEGATAEYPYSEVPVVLIRQNEEQDESEIKRYHRAQSGKIRTMLDQQLQHKRQGIDSVESELSESAFEFLESQFDKAVFLRDKLIEEGKAVEGLNDVGVEENVKFDLSQEPLSL